MAIKITSATYSGLKGILIEVEVEISRGIPAFNIVGLPDASIKEAKERVRAAIINSGYDFPLGRITVNLAPADVKKIGSLLDLPIALGILMQSNQIRKLELNKFIIFGELSLSGNLKGVKGTLPIILAGREEGDRDYIFPQDNIDECSYINEADYYPFSSLKEVISFINYNDILPYEFKERSLIEDEKYLDFSEIIGQEGSKRAMEIAAAGKHNIFVYGSTGSGKTMLANALQSILPSLNKEEEIEIARIHSISGALEKKKIVGRPFRSPHHTITKIALVGGGSSVRAGEITLAHGGILFLDEILEFKREVLEVLREPLEDRSVKIDRLNGSYEMPSDFILVGAFNICPCGRGELVSSDLEGCICSEGQKRKYLSRMSKALIDRVDIFNYVPRVSYREINTVDNNYNSKNMKERVVSARERQSERLKGSKYRYNSEIRGKDIFELCRISRNIQNILENYFSRNNPSLRAYGKLIKLARTIADIDGNKDILESNVLEAINYRKDYYGEII